MSDHLDPFGTAWPNGCCRKTYQGRVCGWPLRDDGTCPASAHDTIKAKQPRNRSGTCPGGTRVIYPPRYAVERILDKRPDLDAMLTPTIRAMMIGAA